MRLSDLYAWPERHRQVADGIGGALLVVTVGTASVTNTMTANPWATVPLSVVLLGALALRRTRPELSFALVLGACLVQLVVLDTPLLADVAAIVSAYSTAAFGRREAVRRLALVAAVVAGPAAVTRWGGGVTTGDYPLATLGGAVGATFLSGLAVVFWVAGDLVRNRRAVTERLAEQNAALRRERDQRVAMAAQGERTRIAREMHDIVAHSLSVIVVQADGGAYAAEHASTWERAQARETLGTVAETARQALAETRRLVGVLRDPGTDDVVDYSPTSSLAELPELVGRLRESGLPVELEVTGEERELPREVDLAAYRVVQEGLTNVLKHAGPGARATVRVEHGPGLAVEVADDGRGAAAEPPADGGNGIIGMRERAVAAGGTLHAGPRPGGGFVVRAQLPVTGRSGT